MPETNRELALSDLRAPFLDGYEVKAKNEAGPIGPGLTMDEDRLFRAPQ